jgi:hypothetical protein
MDALSDSKRERANDWFNNTLLSRLDDKQKGATLVIVCRRTWRICCAFKVSSCP